MHGRGRATTAVFLLALLGAGCADERARSAFGPTARGGRDARTLHINAAGEPEGLDPARSSETLSRVLIAQMFEGLSAFGPERGQVVQGVATRWAQSNDNRLYRFHLRPEARWSDGKPVTAHDFVHAWRRVLDPSLGTRAAELLFILFHGQAFYDGHLLVTRVTTPVRDAPGRDARVSATLAPGTAVRVLSWTGDPERYARVALAPRPTFTLHRAESPAAPLGYVREADLQRDASVLGVRAADDLTLEVELERPAPYFVQLTAMPVTFPVRKDVLETFAQKGQEQLWVRPENIVVNGPYTLERWRFRYELTMTRNPYYWDHDSLRVHRIVWPEVEDMRTAMRLYRTGELDWMGDNGELPVDYHPLLEGKSDFHRFPVLTTYWYELNTRAPPLDDVRVRRALSLALDRQMLADTVAGRALPATHFVPESMGGGYVEQVEADRAAGADPFVQGDWASARARARELLQEAGYDVAPDDQGGIVARGFPTLDLLVDSSDVSERFAVAVQDMWRQSLGVTARIRSQEWGATIKDFEATQFQIYRYGWAADYDHPHSFLSTFLAESAQNHTGWSDPELDALVARAAATADPVASARLYRQAEVRAVEGMCRIPLHFQVAATLATPALRGMNPSGMSIHLVKWLAIGEAPPAPRPFPPPGRIEE